MRKTKTPAERVSEHKNRQKKRGLKRISVWVPEGEADRIKAIAASMRKATDTQLPRDELKKEDGGRYFVI